MVYIIASNGDFLPANKVDRIAQHVRYGKGRKKGRAVNRFHAVANLYYFNSPSIAVTHH